MRSTEASQSFKLVYTFGKFVSCDDLMVRALTQINFNFTLFHDLSLQKSRRQMNTKRCQDLRSEAERTRP